MNKFIHTLLYMGLVVVSIISAKSMYGIVEVPRFRSSFKNKIARYDLAVVHFINYEELPEPLEDVAEKKAEDREKSDELNETEKKLDLLNDMKEAYIEAAESTRYERANVGFIGVDLTQIPQLIEEYDLKGELSTLMLFKDGVPYKSKGTVVKTHDILTSRIKIKDFIDTHFDDLISDILEDLAQQERARPRVTRVYSYPRYRRAYYPAYGYGYGPWGGYWRGGYGWRYPYWRGYGYGGYPYGGFGFGYGGYRGGFGFGLGW